MTETAKSLKIAPGWSKVVYHRW